MKKLSTKFVSIKGISLLPDEMSCYLNKQDSVYPAHIKGTYLTHLSTKLLPTSQGNDIDLISLISCLFRPWFPEFRKKNLLQENCKCHGMAGSKINVPSNSVVLQFSLHLDKISLNKLISLNSANLINH